MEILLLLVIGLSNLLLQIVLSDEISEHLFAKFSWGGHAPRPS